MQFMNKIAFFPGTFDPFTLGHLDIVERGLAIFDKVVIGLGNNMNKQHMFTVEQRTSWIKSIFEHNNKVEVVSYQGLTAKFAEEIGAPFILRGLRTTQDFSYEKQIAYVNEDMSPSVNTVFLVSHQSKASVSSTIVRELIRYNGNYDKYLHPSTVTQIQNLAQI